MAGMTSPSVSCHRAPCGVSLRPSKPVAACLRAPAAAAAATSPGMRRSLPLSKCNVLAGTVLRVQPAGVRLPARRTTPVQARVRDPDLDEGAATLRGPPKMLWKVVAALTYLIPWIDTISLGREIYHNFPSLLWVYFFPGPTISVYYSSQFAPLIIFFLLFLTIVKNTKLHHFVRFNCMQAVMLDIVCMLFHIVRAYFPAEVRWSALLLTFDKFAFIGCMTTVLYCVYFTLRGKYADIPFVSESVYMQVDASEYG